MDVELINGSPDPERLVCRAARNDYRQDGIIGHGFDEVMDDVDADADHLTGVAGEYEDVENPDGEGFRDVIVTESKRRTLLDHLIRSGHWGPFEHPQAVIAIEGVTRVVTHQLVRHRHFSYDQQSFRYVGLDAPMSPEVLEQRFHIPDFDDEVFVRGSVHEPEEEAADVFRESYEDSLEDYSRLIEGDVPQEVARKVLPMGIKTNIVMSGNARAWMHILNVRTKADVQGETRECAEAIFEELKEWMPYTFEKYDEDVLPMELNP